MGRSLSFEEMTKIHDMKKRMQSGENVTADELKSYRARDMMGGRFDRQQELINQTPMYETEISRLKGAGANEKAFDMQQVLNKIKANNPELKPNNNPFYDIEGNVNPGNRAVARSMEITGKAVPTQGEAKATWNLGNYNNTIEGQGGFATPESLASSAAGVAIPIAVHYANQATHGEFNPLDIKSAGEGSEVEANHELPYNSLRELYRQKKFEALK